MKRAKITIIFLVTVSILYNIPHVFITTNIGRQCTPYGTVMSKSYGQFYFWFTVTIQFLIPYTLLLIWNGVIIHTLRKRSAMFDSEEGHSQSQGHENKMKSSERQIIIMLLLVTFGFIILTIPVNVMVFYINFVDVGKSPKSYEGYYLFYNVGQKLYYVNYAVNFFFYVMSGQKFRTDLINLFKSNKKRPNEMPTSNVTTITSA